MYCDVAGDWMRARGGEKVLLRPPVLIKYLLLLIKWKNESCKFHWLSPCRLRFPPVVSAIPQMQLFTLLQVRVRLYSDSRGLKSFIVLLDP
jgi:hypothetical protein